MPRFLNTWTGEFEWHPDPSKVTYAILSHVWRKPEEGGEQSYDDVRKIQEIVKKGRRGEPRSPITKKPKRSKLWLFSTPDILLENTCPKYHEESTIFAHPELSGKIKGFCKVAREAGFCLAWNDACCIDKTSSAELSEAINSMYEWYRLSDMCYVYLADVIDEDITPLDCESTFQQSKWHKRGWTLQELIAPERVVFMKKTWSILGTKAGLARTLEGMTGVDYDVLTGRATLDSISVARRMSWAAERETTCVEDKAYCLMGLFGIHMSPIYGEGENAFLRLQEEIIRTIPDQSIFVSGDSRTLQPLADDSSPDRVCSPGLLANSTYSFIDARDIVPITPSRFARILCLEGSEDLPPMHAIFTPEGVRMRLFCLPLSGVPYLLGLFRELRVEGRECLTRTGMSEVHCLALLQCEDGDGHLVALPLCRPREHGVHNLAFRIGAPLQCAAQDYMRYHTVRISEEVLKKVLKQIRPTVVELCLLRHCSAPPIPKSLYQDPDLQYFNLWNDEGPENPNEIVVSLAPHSVENLRTLSFSPSPLQVAQSAGELSMETTLSFTLQLDDSKLWRVPPPMKLRISLRQLEHGSDTAVRISVHTVNFIELYHPRPSSRSSGTSNSSSGSSPDTSHQITINASDTSNATCDVEYRNGNHSLTLSLPPYGTPRRTIFHVEYMVHSDSDWENDMKTCLVRQLRVGLELPFASQPQSTVVKNLWLFLDMSEIKGYKHPIQSTPSDSSERAQDVLKGPIAPGITTVPSTSQASTGGGSDPNVLGSGRMASIGDAVGRGMCTAAQSAHDTLSGTTPEGTEIIFEEERYMLPCQPNMDSLNECVAAAVPALTEEHTLEWLGDVGRSDPSVYSKNQRSSSRSPSFAPTTRLEGHGALEYSKDAATKYTEQTSVDALRQENDVLRTQIVDLSSRNDTLSSQMQIVALQMSAVLARLDALSGSQGSEDSTGASRWDSQ